MQMRFGATRVQISGPTAAFATIVAGIVATDGLDGLVAATIIAGILLILMVLLKLGTLIRFVPYTITTGFTAGIAVTIVIGQIKDLLGLTYPAGTTVVSTVDKLSAVGANIATFNAQALLVGALIPMPTIAAILLQVAYNMSGWRNFAHLCATASRGAVATLLLTFTLTIAFDLVTTIAVACLLR